METPPLTLLLVRHGQTAWNAAQRLQGQTDVPLDETGVAQAARAGKRLARETLHAIVTSDLARAQATASAVAAHHACPVTVDARLREISFGEWEGMTYAEIGERFPEQLAAWEQDPFHFAPPGGETAAQLANRVAALLRDLRTNYAGQTVAITAHGGPLQMLICLALEIAPEKRWQFTVRPGSVSELAFYPAGAILNYLNERNDDR